MTGSTQEAARLIKDLVRCGLVAAVLGASSLAFADAGREPGWRLPHDVSKDGHHITSLLHTTFVFLVIAFVVMVAWIGISIFVHNEKHTAAYEKGESKGAMLRVFGIAASIFLIIDGNLWVNSTLKLGSIFWNFAEVEKKPDVLRIEVVGRQWIWQGRYAGPDGQFNTQDDALVTNDIRVPVDTPIYLQLSSPDVLHAFYLPNFRNKQDVVPGMINHMWFEAKETGVFEIGCAQHCGANHYKMAGHLTVLGKDEFQAWLEQASADSARVWDAEDIEAHWGWKWRKPKE